MNQRSSTKPRTIPSDEVNDKQSSADGEESSLPVPLKKTRRSVATAYRKGQDILESFESAILFVRWGAITVTAMLFAINQSARHEDHIPWIILLLVNAVLRTVKPLTSHPRNNRDLFQLCIEVGIHTLTVAMTGLWESPWTFSLVVAVLIAGLARGRLFASAATLGAATFISGILITQNGADSESISRSITWTAALLLAGITGGYGSILIRSDETDPQTDSTTRIRRLNDANRLLTDLHHVAQTLPASLDYKEVLQSSTARLRDLFFFESIVIFTVDHVDNYWTAVHQEGLPVKSRFNHSELPTLARFAAQERQLTRAGTGPQSSRRLVEGGQSAMYAPLLAGGNLIGLLAVESREHNAFTYENSESLKGFVEPVGLAIDNARWFQRIRTVSADEERLRIARDLHDRLGQSLAYLGFELDRVIFKHMDGADIAPALLQLRRDIRNIVGEVRETLYDLRTDVAEQKDFVEAVKEFALRLENRNDLKIDISADNDHRLPILQEREMWRIAQEALINIERHADATEVNVFWSCTDTQALVEISDNGRGIQPDKSGRLDSYGIIGMRERATSIGASLELTSSPKQGTKVRCFLKRI